MSEPNRIDNTNREIVRSAFNGWFMLVLNIVLFFGGLALLLREFQRSSGEPGFNWLIILGIGLPILAVILLTGLFTLQPNEARVLILFGAYHGTVRSSGFSWANPFCKRPPTRRDDAGAPSHPTSGDDIFLCHRPEYEGARRPSLPRESCPCPR